MTRELSRATSRPASRRTTSEPRRPLLGVSFLRRRTGVAGPVAAPERTEERSRPSALRRGVRRGLAAALATTATAAVVAGGVAAATPSTGADPAAAELVAQIRSTPIQPQAVEQLKSERTVATSRSADRTAVDRVKLDRLRGETRSGGQETRTKDLGGGDPKSIARSMLGEFGFSGDQFGCLDLLWTRESGWNPQAANPTSSAYGIPQALPGSKMATAGADWATNPATQIRWGLGYIQDRYGSPCGAWGHSESYGWY